MENEESLPLAPEETLEKKPVRECAGFKMIPIILANGQEILV